MSPKRVNNQNAKASINFGVVHPYAEGAQVLMEVL